MTQGESGDATGQSDSMDRSKPIRFGVVGTGRITRRMVAELQSTEGVEVTAIASRDGQRARWYADQYGIAAAVQSYSSLLERDDVDAVYIALPPSLHHPWVIAAAESGKSVLCEKPFAVTADEVTAMVAACQDHGVRWLDATAWLHHQRTAAIANWIGLAWPSNDPSSASGTSMQPSWGATVTADRAAELGRLVHISAAVSFYQPFQSGDHRLDASLGGGCLLDLGWYACGLARFAAGRLPRAVVADVVVKAGVSQRVTAMLWFDDDVTATISCGYDAATRKWFEVAGSNASLVCDDFTRPWPDRPARYWIHDASGQVTSHTFEDNQERSMIGRFISPEPLDAWHQQAIQTQQILDALQRSADQGSCRVEL